MAGTDYITNLEGNFFWQLERDEPFVWLTCTGVGDLEIPSSERTAQYCPDPLNSGQVKIHGFTHGAPSAGTYSLVKPLGKVSNALLELDCDFVGRINWVCRGIRQDPNNYEVALIMLDSGDTRKGVTNPVGRSGDEEARVDTNADINFSNLMVIYRLVMDRIDMINTSNALSVYFMPSRCEDRCGAARAICQEGLMGMVGPGAYIYESEVKKTHDGSTWAATPTDPYSWGGDTGPVYIIETVSGMTYIVFRSESVAGAPAECAISDDLGVTWTNITIGAVGGQYVTNSGFAILGATFFVCCDDGYIYSSGNQGMTWTLRDNGGAASNNALNDIVAYSTNIIYAVGDGNTVVRSLNGGTIWAAVTGPAAGQDLLSCAVNDLGHLFVGTDNGRLYVSQDQGATWTLRLDFGSGTIDWIEADEHSFGMALVWNNTTPRGYLYRSVDGGQDWERIDTPDNDGLNDGHICDINNIVVVGNVEGGTTFVARTSPTLGV